MNLHSSPFHELISSTFYKYDGYENIISYPMDPHYISIKSSFSMGIFHSYVSLPEGNHQFLAASPFFGSTHPPNPHDISIKSSLTSGKLT